jgi:peptidoglycan/LPS O-acetylase OafA/YrhL
LLPQLAYDSIMHKTAAPRQAVEPGTARPFRLGHRPELDGLRAIFILLVLGVHSGVPFMQGAGLGVDGFFVLSGFLITCLLMQEWQQRGSISLKRFYMRRALRLLPALFAMLAFVGLITLVALRGEGAVATGRGVMLSFLYVSNWVTIIFPDYNIGLGLLSHSWSLALEEQFYLVWPFLLIGLLALPIARKYLVICVGGLALLAPLVRVWIASDFTEATFYLGMNTRADALLVGCFLGLLATGGFLLPSARAAAVTRWLLLAASAVLAYLIVEPLWFHGEQIWIRDLPAYSWAFALIALCFAAPIVHVLVSPRGRVVRILSWKPLAAIGVVSYGIYLWHNPLFMLLPTGPAGWLDLPVQFVRFAGTAALVTLSYRYIEQPALRIKDRLTSRSHGETSLPHMVPVTSPEAV